MSLNVLKAYILKCKEEDIDPTWRGLKKFRETM